jgi:hypothetical protein
MALSRPRLPSRGPRCGLPCAAASVAAIHGGDGSVGRQHRQPRPGAVLHAQRFSIQRRGSRGCPGRSPSCCSWRTWGPPPGSSLVRLGRGQRVRGDRRVRARRRFVVYPGEFISSVLACIARRPTYTVVVRCPCPYRHVRIVHRIPKSDKSALCRASNRAPCLSPHECFLNSADPLSIRPSSNSVGLLCSCPSTAAPMPQLSPNPLI